MAIGLSLNTKDFEKFKQEFEQYAKEKIKEELVPELVIDEIVTEKDVNIDAVKELSILEPFGEANDAPMIIFKNLKIIAIRTLSEGKHLKLALRSDNQIFDAIGFNLGNYADLYQIGDDIDVVGNLEINNFNNMEKVQINLKDIRISI